MSYCNECKAYEKRRLFIKSAQDSEYGMLVCKTCYGNCLNDSNVKKKKDCEPYKKTEVLLSMKQKRLAENNRVKNQNSLNDTNAFLARNYGNTNYFPQVPNN